MSGLERVLRPRSIAVIGGGTWCANVIEQCRRIGFSGEIWPVHPARTALAGLPAYPNVTALPGAPDAAFVGVNRDLTIDVVRALAAQGAGGAVCFASGFSEAQAETADGAAKQAALLQAAGEMTVLGPNCYGFVNYLDGAALWPDQHGGVRVERGVALVTQSSNIALNLTMQARGLPIAYVVTVGNQAQTGLSEVARALLRDDRVTALGLHIEGIDDLRGFEALAREAALHGKPIVALKIGRSDQARAATISHTASLAGSDAGARALLRRLGVAQVDTLPVLLEALKVLHVVGKPASNRIASLSCSGGEASLMADVAHGTGVVFPALNEAQTRALQAALGPRVALANPLDYHTYIWGDVTAMTACFSAMMQGDVALGCVVLDFPRTDRCDPSAWEPVIEAVTRTKAATGRPMAIVASLAEAMPDAIATRLVALGILPFAGMAEAIAALAATALPEPETPPLPLLLPPAPVAGRVLSEAEAKVELARAGLRIPAHARADSPGKAAEAAARIGFPVVLKAEGIAHKTEAGAVALGLNCAEDVARAATAMPANCVLVEAMITGTVVELLIGVVADPAHGYVLTLAAGGILTEVLDDSALCWFQPRATMSTTPCEACASRRCFKGYRGADPANIDAVLDAVMAVQAYVSKALPQEIEINPLMCGPSGATVADALIRTGDPI